MQVNSCDFPRYSTDSPVHVRKSVSDHRNISIKSEKGENGTSSQERLSENERAGKKKKKKKEGSKKNLHQESRANRVFGQSKKSQ